LLGIAHQGPGRIGTAGHPPMRGATRFIITILTGLCDRPPCCCDSLISCRRFLAPWRSNPSRSPLHSSRAFGRDTSASPCRPPRYYNFATSLKIGYYYRVKGGAVFVAEKDDTKKRRLSDVYLTRTLLLRHDRGGCSLGDETPRANRRCVLRQLPHFGLER
jgi:hypothetical protein